MPNPFIEYWHGFIVIFFSPFPPLWSLIPGRNSNQFIISYLYNLSSKQYNIDNGILPLNIKEKRPLLLEKSNDQEL